MWAHFTDPTSFTMFHDLFTSSSFSMVLVILHPFSISPSSTVKFSDTEQLIRARRILSTICLQSSLGADTDIVKVDLIFYLGNVVNLTTVID